jgi:glycerol-3-phosphate dehydrogenase
MMSDLGDPIRPQPHFADIFEQLAQDTWDVLVVGGGIVGAGIARDAAMRGLRVALVDRRDFAFGTSSRSSRLLHGGLRYLAQGRIGLVHEASVEKCTIHRIAPHLAAPLPFLFPTYRHTPWARWKLSIGVRIYDLLCGQRNLGPSSTLSVAQIQEKLPGINPRDLTGGVRYFDGLTNDARLVLDTLRSATLHGALARNHTALVSSEPDGSLWRCRLRDAHSEREINVKTRAIVNATGCWADQLPHSRVRLRLTKGVHLVLDQERFPIPEATVMAEGKRILFAIPWGERVILGTTDTDYEGSLEDVQTEPQDTDYVLEVANRAFPDARLQPSDVLATWAGVRPLIAPRSVKKGTPSDTSRNHQIHMPEHGWIDVAGGKLTTYRLMAEQTVDLVAKTLGRQLPPCRTAVDPLLPPEAVAGVSGILPPAVTQSAVEHYCVNEWALHLDDVMMRRTSWSYYHPNANDIACQVAQWMGAALGWTEQERETEWKRWLALPH